MQLEIKTPEKFDDSHNSVSHNNFYEILRGGVHFGLE